MPTDDLHGAVAACLGRIIGADDVPAPAADHPEPWTVWRVWLAERGLGLVDLADAHAGGGLAADRYFDGAGTFSNPHSTGHDLTLIEAEVVDELGLAPEEARRNVVTRGIDLNALVGRRFRVGEAECVGR